MSDENEVVRMRKVFAKQAEFAQAIRGHEVGVVDNGDEHFAGAMDFEGLLDEQPFAAMIMAFELDLESLAKDAQGVVVSVKGPVDYGSDHAFGILIDQRLLEDAFACARLAQKQTEAALLGVNAEDVEDFLLMREQRDGLGVERISLEAKVRANHKSLVLDGGFIPRSVFRVGRWKLVFCRWQWH